MKHKIIFIVLTIVLSVLSIETTAQTSTDTLVLKDFKCYYLIKDSNRELTLLARIKKKENIKEKYQKQAVKNPKDTIEIGHKEWDESLTKVRFPQKFIFFSPEKNTLKVINENVSWETNYSFYLFLVFLLVGIPIMCLITSPTSKTKKERKIIKMVKLILFIYSYFLLFFIDGISDAFILFATIISLALISEIIPSLKKYLKEFSSYILGILTFIFFIFFLAIGSYNVFILILAISMLLLENILIFINRKRGI